MIYCFGGRNFYSFRDDFIVDFRVKPQASEREIFQTDARGQKCNTIMAVFGANASGKTRLLQALGFLRYFIGFSAVRTEPDEKLDDCFFRFQTDRDKTTELFVEFEMEGEHYRYEVTFNPDHVEHEALKRLKSRFSYVFERELKGDEYEFKSQDFGRGSSIPQRKNASLISTAVVLENPIALKVYRFFETWYGNLEFYGRSNSHDPEVDNLMRTAEFFDSYPNHLDWVNKRLKNFDLGLTGIGIKKFKVVGKDGKEEQHYMPYGEHRCGGKIFTLPILLESTGTQSLFVMLRYLLPVLESGGLAFIDEFEHGLHSHMIPRLVDLFLSKKYNPKGAQLIFSCHSDYVLHSLEKYQIQLVEKDEEGVSTTFRLDEIKGVRNVDNHYARYHSGAYGGVPAF